MALQHLARPSPEPGANPFHYVIVHVDGTKISTEVIGVDWGQGFALYRSNSAVLDSKPWRAVRVSLRSLSDWSRTALPVRPLRASPEVTGKPSRGCRVTSARATWKRSDGQTGSAATGPTASAASPPAAIISAT